MDLKKRIKKNQEFKEIIDCHKFVKEIGFNLYYRFNSNNDFTRFGISASKKVGNAVIRNKVKRRIRGILKDILLKHTNLDLIFIAKKEILNCNYENLKTQIEDAIKRIK